eukprot:gb/GECG01015790.1/.p1 GENE.gb/GECG01015790.1/~~gb/GECG01015790.1/.p1  ORF type:complete len:324 (+),score=19.42 gb/GECG01015790.1/:1-972(+)
MFNRSGRSRSDAPYPADHLQKKHKHDPEADFRRYDRRGSCPEFQGKGDPNKAFKMLGGNETGKHHNHSFDNIIPRKRSHIIKPKKRSESVCSQSKVGLGVVSEHKVMSEGNETASNNMKSTRGKNNIFRKALCCALGSTQVMSVPSDSTRERSRSDPAKRSYTPRPTIQTCSDGPSRRATSGVKSETQSDPSSVHGLESGTLLKTTSYNTPASPSTPPAGQLPRLRSNTVRDPNSPQYTSTKASPFQRRQGSSSGIQAGYITALEGDQLELPRAVSIHSSNGNNNLSQSQSQSLTNLNETYSSSALGVTSSGIFDSPSTENPV